MKLLWLLLLALKPTSWAIILPIVEPMSLSSGFCPSTSQVAAGGGEHLCSAVPSPDVTLDLTMDFERKSPAAVLRELSEAAVAYNIENQDSYGGGATWLAEFESEVASLLGKEAALFCPSGVMAQLIALKIHARATTKPSSHTGSVGHRGRGSFLVHGSSHLLLHEHDAHKELIELDAVKVGVFERPASFGDLVEALSDGGKREKTKEDSSLDPPCCFVLEIPHRELGGACTSMNDIKAMSILLKDQGVAFHCDGARLWEGQPFCGESFATICANFDSAYVSFYKGLGGMTGAMLVGSDSFVAEARVWLRRFGGNVYTSLPYALSCLHAFRTQVGTFEGRWHKLKRITSLIDKLDYERTASITGTTRTSTADSGFDSVQVDENEGETSGGGADAATARGTLVRFEPAVPQCSMVHCYIQGSQGELEQARDEVLAEKGVKVFNRLRGTGGAGLYARPGECYFEWNVGPANGSIEDEVFVEAWAAFLNKIGAGGTSMVDVRY